MPGIISLNLPSISIALSLSLFDFTTCKAKAKHFMSLLLRFPSPTFTAPPPLWLCSVGFSLRLFNSSHIFFIDFSTPAFLWSLRTVRFDGNYLLFLSLLLLLLFWPAHKIDFLSHVLPSRLPGSQRAFTLSLCHKIYVYVVKFSSIFSIFFFFFFFCCMPFDFIACHCGALKSAPSYPLCLSRSPAQRPHQV